MPNISNEPIPVPYAIKVSSYSRPPNEKQLPTFYYAHAVLMAVDSGSKCSVLFVVFPEAGDQLVAYVICADSNKVGKEVRSVRTGLEEAIRKGDQSGLDRCPDWVVRSCSYDGCYCKVHP